MIGRTKADSIEIARRREARRRPHHRVVIEDDDGEELEVLRRSTPFGSAAEQGLYFALFSTDTSGSTDARPHVRPGRRRSPRPPARLHPGHRPRPLVLPVARGAGHPAPRGRRGRHAATGRPVSGDATSCRVPNGAAVSPRQRRVRWGDADERGRLRLDSIARYLQDIGNDDTRDRSATTRRRGSCAAPRSTWSATAHGPARCSR